MCVLNHHHSGIDHGTNGNRNTPEGHDVGVDTLVAHHDKGGQDANRQGYDCHERRAQVKQEEQTDHRHHNELLDELVLKVGNRAFNQLRAVIGGNDFHARRQATLELLELGFDGLNGLQCIFAGAHDDDASSDFPVTIQLGDAAAHLRSDLNAGYITQAHGDALCGRTEWDIAEVLQTGEVAFGSNHVLSLSQLNDSASSFLVGALDGVQHLGMGDSERTQQIGVEHYLVLAHHAA